MTLSQSTRKRKTSMGEVRQEDRHVKYILRLYVAGATPRSARTITELKNLCESYLKERYDLEVIDIYQRPNLARDEQIIATPTLIRKLPPPFRKYIGRLQD